MCYVCVCVAMFCFVLALPAVLLRVCGCYVCSLCDGFVMCVVTVVCGVCASMLCCVCAPCVRFVRMCGSVACVLLCHIGLVLLVGCMACYWWMLVCVVLRCP